MIGCSRDRFRGNRWRCCIPLEIAWLVFFFFFLVVLVPEEGDLPISYFFPLCSTGENGDPVATRAFPSVQAYKSSGVASCSFVGFDKGNIAGLSTCFAISLTTCSVKDFGHVEQPTKT